MEVLEKSAQSAQPCIGTATGGGAREAHFPTAPTQYFLARRGISAPANNPKTGRKLTTRVAGAVPSRGRQRPYGTSFTLSPSRIVLAVKRARSRKALCVGTNTFARRAPSRIKLFDTNSEPRDEVWNPTTKKQCAKRVWAAAILGCRSVDVTRAADSPSGASAYPAAARPPDRTKKTLWARGPN